MPQSRAASASRAHLQVHGAQVGPLPLQQVVVAREDVGCVRLEDDAVRLVVPPIRVEEHPLAEICLDLAGEAVGWEGRGECVSA